MASIGMSRMGVWVVGQISPWEMNRFSLELDGQIEQFLGSVKV